MIKEKPKRDYLRKVIILGIIIVSFSIFYSLVIVPKNKRYARSQCYDIVKEQLKSYTENKDKAYDKWYKECINSRGY